MSLNIFPVLGQELNEDISDNSLSYEYSLELNNSYDKDSYQLLEKTLEKFNIPDNKSLNGNLEFSLTTTNTDLSDKLENDIVLTTSKGNITINNVKYPFKAEGYLHKIVEEDNIVYLGGLKGYLNNSKDPSNTIILSIHWSPDSNKISVPITFGYEDEKGTMPIVIKFGEIFKEAQKAVKHNMVDNKTLSDSNSININNYTNNQMLASGPYDTQYRDKDTQYSDGVGIALYSPLKIKPNSGNTGMTGAKLWANKNKLTSYASNAGYSPYSSDAAGCWDDVYLTIRSNSSETDFKNECKPTDSNKSVSIPVWLSVYSQSITLSLDLTVDSITTTLYSGGSYGFDYATRWKFEKFAPMGQLFDSSSDPEESSTGGFAVRNDFQFARQYPSSSTFRFYAEGETQVYIVNTNYENIYFPVDIDVYSTTTVE
jgi:hypothetical protein